MDQRNFLFLCYGLVTAWAVLMIYVVMLVRREKKINYDMAELRRLVEQDTQNAIQK